MDYKRAYCKICNKNVKAQDKGTSHWLHFIFTILTGGLWAVIWLLCGMSSNWQCSECGGKKMGRVK